MTTHPPPLHLSEILNLSPQHDRHCIGLIKDESRRCLLPVTSENCSEGSRLLELATKQLYMGHRIDDILEDIAFLLLCKRWHRSKALEVSVKWKSQVYRYLAATATAAAATTVQDPPAEQPRHKSHHNVEASVPVPSLRDTSIPRQSDCGQINQSRSQGQSQTHRDTRLYTSSHPSSSSSCSTEAKAETDSSSEMFARTSRPRRVLMPTRFNSTKVCPDEVSKRDSRVISTITHEVIVSCSTSAPLPKVNRSMSVSPSGQSLEDRSNIIDAHMQKLQLMEPAEDVTDDEEETPAREEEQKASLLQELQAIVPSRERPSKLVRASFQELETLLRGVVDEETKRVVDEYMDEVRRMDYGGDETDTEDDDEMKEKEKCALVAQIAHIGQDIKRAHKRKRRAHSSRKMPKEIKTKTKTEESPLTSKPSDVVHPVPVREDASKMPKDIDVSVNVNKPTTQTPDVITIIQPIKGEIRVSIITDIRETVDESDNQASASPHSSPSSTFSSFSTRSFPSPFSSISSLGSLERSRDLLYMAMQEPHMKNHIINNHDDKKSNCNNTNPHLHLSTTQPRDSLPIKIPDPIVLLNNQYPQYPENPYPALTTGVAIGIALFDGLAWLLNRRNFSVTVGLGLYLGVLSVVGLL
ncbi:uncharacterized protein KD926_004406 [Aspergillus affinis]|uniref:uncharacterized protein n=1 Tax=Aspergillus affinis TaxID=1070780 RepID=UPI0022FF337B|nr:uncharacterized protein KD926_004406 [Aspergillus affinis]KAI9043222.1 hypothetical protein KD926_004406 [Aspergillus affinis]